MTSICYRLPFRCAEASHARAHHHDAFAIITFFPASRLYQTASLHTIGFSSAPSFDDIMGEIFYGEYSRLWKLLNTCYLKGLLEG